LKFVEFVLSAYNSTKYRPWTDGAELKFKSQACMTIQICVSVSRVATRLSVVFKQSFSWWVS